MNQEHLLIEKIADFKQDPLGFILFIFPWGEEGELEKERLRDWQIKLLRDCGELLKNNSLRGSADVIQYAVASGHGVGKSALVAMLIYWAMSTCVDCNGVITANTENQLMTKTWPQLAKWHRLALNRHWFHHTATRFYSVDPKHERTWRIDMIPWSEENTEAFAGLHNKGRRILLIFDEASAIPDKIWEVAEGALTDEDTEILWFVFGNPTRNSGRFFDCFNRLAHRWHPQRVDARTVPGTNKKQIQRWLEDYGEDSDFFRVRVRGLHPRASDLQFIPQDWVYAAQHREFYVTAQDPLVIGIDLARGGSDLTVIQYRRGPDCRTVPQIVIPGFESRDTTPLVAKITDLALTTDRFMRPDAVFLDGTGVGGPLVDRLRQLGVPVSEVQGKWRANDPKYGNFRTEMWAKMREALRETLALPNDPSLEADLCSVEYTHNMKDQLILETKEDLKARIGRSPDKGDALAFTFAFPVERREETEFLRGPGMVNRAETDYDPYSRA
jgi:hypothetical protein